MRERDTTFPPPALVKYRLCVFNEESIDRYNLGGVLFFQIIGNAVAFFVMQLNFQHLYTAAELVRLYIPTKKSSLLDIMGHIDNLLFVASIYRDHCVVSKEDLATRRCETLSSTYLDAAKNNQAPRK